MLSFSGFLLTEDTLTHITHLEDLIFDNPISSIIAQVEDIVRALSGGDSNALSLKIDGAPSIVAGTNPENGRFFVATKSLFNKTPKINYSPEDCDANHGHAPDLADKLKAALRYLPRVFPKGLILQGDYMFGGTNKGVTRQKIDGVTYLTFTPNSLTYAVPVNSALARKITDAKIGIVWHTTYTGNSISSLSASPGANTDLIGASKNVFTMGTKITDISPALLSTSEQRAIRAVLKKYSGLKTTFSPSMYQMLMRFINDRVKSQQEGPPKVSDFINFVTDVVTKQAETYKTQTKRDAVLDTIHDYEVEATKKSLQSVFNAHHDLTLVKNVLLSKLNLIRSFPAVFTQTPDGFKVANEEGYVFAGKQGTVVKIVDRLGFSLFNFLNSKNR